MALYYSSNLLQPQNCFVLLRKCHFISADFVGEKLGYFSFFSVFHQMFLSFILQGGGILILVRRIGDDVQNRESPANIGRVATYDLGTRILITRFPFFVKCGYTKKQVAIFISCLLETITKSSMTFSMDYSNMWNAEYKNDFCSFYQVFKKFLRKRVLFM